MPIKQKSKPIPSENWTTNFIKIIQECRAENQDLRLGQLLYNLISKEDMRINKLEHASNENYEEDFHTRLFYIEDEDLIRIIEKYGKTGKL